MLEEEGVNIPYNVILTKVFWQGLLFDFYVILKSDICSPFCKICNLCAVIGCHFS